jgi:adenylate kinase family enzyme
MMRVGFIGVPGAGKTSTARGLASVCRRIDGLNSVELSAEYARRYIAKYGPIEETWEQYRILKKQLDWENSVGNVDLLLTDGPIFLSLMYAMDLS